MIQNGTITRTKTGQLPDRYRIKTGQKSDRKRTEIG